MNPEVLKEVGNFINQFGFPIFFGLIALFFAFRTFKYFTNYIDEMTKRHQQVCDNKDAAFVKYVENRDAQMTQIVTSTTGAIRENTHATYQLRDSVERRIITELRHAEVIEKQNEILGSSEAPATTNQINFIG